MENQSSQPEINGKDFCCCKALSEAEKAAKELRGLMKDKVGDEKCALCKAAQELEKVASNPSSGFDFSLFFLVMMLLFPFTGSSDTPSFMQDSMKVYLDMLEKERKEKEDFHFKTVAETESEAH